MRCVRSPKLRVRGRGRGIHVAAEVARARGPCTRSSRAQKVRARSRGRAPGVEYRDRFEAAWVWRVHAPLMCSRYRRHSWLHACAPCGCRLDPTLVLRLGLNRKALRWSREPAAGEAIPYNRPCAHRAACHQPAQPVSFCFSRAGGSPPPTRTPPSLFRQLRSKEFLNKFTSLTNTLSIRVMDRMTRGTVSSRRLLKKPKKPKCAVV